LTYHYINNECYNRIFITIFIAKIYVNHIGSQGEAEQQPHPMTPTNDRMENQDGFLPSVSHKEGND
jgi:hypothetical protein